MTSVKPLVITILLIAPNSYAGEIPAIDRTTTFCFERDNDTFCTTIDTKELQAVSPRFHISSSGSEKYYTELRPHIKNLKKDVLENLASVVDGDDS